MIRVAQRARSLCQQEGQFPESAWELYLSTAAEQIAFEANPFGRTDVRMVELDGIARQSRVNRHGFLPLLHELATRGSRIVGG